MSFDVLDVVLPGIFVTSFDNAQDIVKAGEANPSDFWLFCGICGWETSSFYREMHEEGLWHIVSTDSESVLEELNMLRCEEEEEQAVAQNCDVDHDPRNAGLHTWSMLMEKVGLETEARKSEDSFGDLMLHEWATEALALSVKEEQSSMIMSPSFSNLMFVDGSDFDVSGYDPASVMPSELDSSSAIVGVMVRATSAKRSPFMLSDQCYHKSVILILRDDNNYSEGIILNHVTDRTYRLNLDGRTIDLPIRFGGPAYYLLGDDEDEDKDEDIAYETPTIFLHSSKSLREAGFGIPIGKSKIYLCTREEVINVFELNLANSDEFIAVQGSSIWTKKGISSGVLGDIESGFFEPVPMPTVKDVWNVLRRQSLLSDETLPLNVILSRRAWELASKNAIKDDNEMNNDAVKVFGTDIDVGTLADEASLRWIKVNLLTLQ